MKKLFGFIALVFMIVCLFVSCNGKDKDNGKDNNGNLWIYIIIGAVVVIAGAIAFVLLKKKTADKIKEK